MSNKFMLSANVEDGGWLHNFPDYVKRIELVSIRNFRKEISGRTTPDSGLVKVLAKSFHDMNAKEGRNRFNFDLTSYAFGQSPIIREIEAGAVFDLKVFIWLVDENRSIKFGTRFRFKRCAYRKSYKRGDTHVVEASYDWFDWLAD